MDTEAKIMYLAVDIDRSEGAERAALGGFDFGPILGYALPDTSEPLPSLYALTMRGIVQIERPDVQVAHRSGVGWRWTVADPSQYPNPPFLLTTDPRVKVRDCGHVRVHPTQVTRAVIASESEWYGRFDTPVLSENWFGWLTIQSQELQKGLGSLLAFHLGPEGAPETGGEVIMADNDQTFGLIETLP